jgi:O-antigen/teichoic acid export membrane protein
VFRRAAPVVGLSLLGLLLFNSGLFFLWVVRGREAVGYYAAAYTLIGFLSNIGLAYAMSLIPGMAHLGRGTKGELALYHRSLAESLAVALPVAAGAFLFSKQIIELAFGPGYSQSATALALLAWSIPLATVRNVPLAALIARGRQGLLVRATLFAAVGNIALNAALAAPFGIVGVTIAAVLTECLAGVLMLRYAAREGLELASPGRLWRSALSTVAMVLVIGALGRPALAVGVPIGVSVYVIALAAVGGIRFRGGPIPSLEL